MLQNGLCERAYISDISAPSMQKAETLLKEYIAAGKCIPVCADGLSGIPERCGRVLIAGMGGEEIVKILSQAELPQMLVLQPMKNTEKVRAFLAGHGYAISYDGTFFADKKYYDLICAREGGNERYTEFELAFGRDNLNNPAQAFYKRTVAERNKLRALLAKEMKEESRGKLLERLRKLEVIVGEFEDDL